MKEKFKEFRKKFDWRTLVIFLPGLIFVSMFTFYPMIKMFLMSFTDWNIGLNQTSPFVGFENYYRVLTDPIAHIALENTFLYLLLTVPTQMILGLLVALMINKITKFSIPFRVLYYLPVISSWVVVALLFRYIFNNDGLMNYFLMDVLHITNEKIGWLSTRFSALFAASILGVWKGIGWNMIIFLAALQAVPKDYYEAADIDGANAWKKFMHITLPMIKGTFTFALVMLTIGAFNTYTPIAVLTEGNPHHQTEVVLTWLNFKTFSALDMGYSAALSMILMALIVIITITMLKVINRKEK
ncbi:sugar ABC transporter permease [Acholeplasma laidlawii]|uniref:carbohydrate ABC transporter permease n=1 Tax=Acholeplasma laidlawii TaxID=2148 RepID=UPI0018C261BA|nr:sugar ABC transporter permease [Acholeplasma laidlawii]MBG0762694.1 sugar ABC transporter permease [Acholeplasma laidlawii]